MKVEVLNTGSELLLGNVVNTHLAYLGRQLFPLGLRIERQTTVPDGDAIRGALVEAFPRCDVILVTGGLGPTTDDITREVTAELLGLPLTERPEVMAAIQQRLQRRGIPYRERMGRQAMAPEGAVVLPNENGTAPGLYLPARQSGALTAPHLFLLPGPPRELRPMFEASVLPILTAIPGLVDPSTECRIYHVVGMGESAVEEVIGLSLNARGDIEVGYCARPNEVDFRLIGPPALLDEVEPSVLAALGSHIVSQSGKVLEEVVIELLRENHATLATAESCTGGLVASRLTDVSGSSEVFMEGMVTYSNAAKTRALGVPADLISANGAVSEPVARAMAEGARARANTRYALSLTGVAGPTGGTPEKPVGTVFIALAEDGKPTVCLHEKFPTDRETFKRLASQAALDLLRRRLLNEPIAS